MRGTMEKTRVLIVDDELDMCNFLEEAIAPLGCEVKSLQNSEMVLETCSAFMPHVVLLDVMMPKLNGLEVLRKIREIDKQVRVIMVSGMLDLGLAKEAMALGAIDYMAKPLDIDKLKDIVKKAAEETFG